MATPQLRSTTFASGQPLPARSAYAADNLSPELEWSDFPPTAAEIVICCLDPDAPHGTWVHWIAAGIDPMESRSEEGKPPAGAVEGRNSYGQIGYGGPHPPEGDKAHRYFFQVYALSSPSGLPEGFSYEDLQSVLADREMAAAELMGTYQR